MKKNSVMLISAIIATILLGLSLFVTLKFDVDWLLVFSLIMINIAVPFWIVLIINWIRKARGKSARNNYVILAIIYLFMAAVTYVIGYYANLKDGGVAGTIFTLVMMIVEWIILAVLLVIDICAGIKDRKKRKIE